MNERGIYFENCTLSGNRATWWGGALLLEAVPECTLTNNIFWLNTSGRDGNEIALRKNSYVSLAYSNVQQNVESIFVDSSTLEQLSGNMALDPCFVSPGHWRPDNSPGTSWVGGDYHLKSQAGRWDPRVGTWVTDLLSSPCIDSGDPTCQVNVEPSPNGGIINIGAYGGTPEASKSP